MSNTPCLLVDECYVRLARARDHSERRMGQVRTAYYVNGLHWYSLGLEHVNNALDHELFIAEPTSVGHMG